MEDLTPECLLKTESEEDENECLLPTASVFVATNNYKEDELFVNNESLDSNAIDPFCDTYRFLD